ncbi:2,3-diaminopropionate biosynthesis protein SbnB [Sorangium sp. So ce1128]
MLYLNEKDLHKIGINWHEIVAVIEHAVHCLGREDFAQPIKPYLRYRDPKNRIIAMPAFLGGTSNVAGLKWIASFPGNIEKGLPRAHSVVVLNDADTGRPIAIINTALLSVIRTAAVSGLMMTQLNQVRPLSDFNLGITGFGPIGQYHLRMCASLFGAKLRQARVYDPRPVDADAGGVDPKRLTIARSWQEAYDDADVFMTCTVSQAPYIDRAPKAGSLQLNVSLRDYKTDIFEHLKGSIVVDDWAEVCREKTDIEVFHLEKGLRKEDVRSIVDVVCGAALKGCPPGQPIMFNPMGMGVFDMAVAKYYYRKALAMEVGTQLEPIEGHG